jgi:hypothetical protein
MKICDVCYSDKGLVRLSTHTIWHKKREQYGEQKVTLDTCREHSNLYRGNAFDVNKTITENIKSKL